MKNLKNFTVALFFMGLSVIFTSCEKEDIANIPPSTTEISHVSSDTLESRVASWKWTYTGITRKKLGVCGAKWYNYGTQKKCFWKFNCAGYGTGDFSWRCSCDCNQ